MVIQNRTQRTTRGPPLPLRGSRQPGPAVSSRRQWFGQRGGEGALTMFGKRGQRDMGLIVEPLESRQLLTSFTGFSHVRNIATASGVYSLQLSDQSVLKANAAGNGQIDVKLLGTTSSSTLTITLVRPRYHLPSNVLSIRNLTIKSGEIGSILAAPAQLDGTMTPLTSSVSTLDFGGLGPRAQIDVNGSVDAMNLGRVLLGPNGHVIIGGNLNGTTVPTNSSSTSSSGTGSVTIDGTVTGTITATGTGSGTAPTTPQTVGAI